MANIDINLMCEETLDEPLIETKPIFVQLNDELVEVIQIETVNYYDEEEEEAHHHEQEHQRRIPPNFLELINKYEPVPIILPHINSNYNADIAHTKVLPGPGIDSSVTENLFSQFNNFDSNEHETVDFDNVEHEFKFEPPDPTDIILEPKCELVVFENENGRVKKGKINKRKNTTKLERKVETSASAKNPNIFVRRSARLKISKTPSSSSAIIKTEFIKSEPQDDYDYGDSVNSNEDPASDVNDFLEQKLIIPSDPDPDPEETELEDRSGSSTSADYYSISQLFDPPEPSRKSRKSQLTTAVAPLLDEGEHDFQPFQCQLCPKAFKLKYLLQYHIESHNKPDYPSRDYKCHKCSRAYVYKCQLIKHQRTHSKNVKKPFTCQVPGCGKGFCAKGNLKLHALVHSEDRPFKCPHPGCGSAFKYSNYMKLHVLTHIDKEEQERPFVCNLCGMSFQFNSGLAQHHRTAHSTARPFSCPHSTCEKTFKNKHEIIEHLRFHVDETKCLHPDCHKFFKCPKLLQKHFRTHLL